VNEIWNIFEDDVYRYITKDLTQARITVHSDHPKSRMLVAFTGWEPGEPKGEKTERKSTWCFRCLCERRKGRNARKIDMEFPRFFPKGVTWPPGRFAHKFYHDTIRKEQSSFYNTAVRRIFTEVSSSLSEQLWVNQLFSLDSSYFFHIFHIFSSYFLHIWLPRIDTEYKKNISVRKCANIGLKILHGNILMFLRSLSSI